MQKNLIYDVGMNNGDDTAYYLSKGFNVVAIEANPILVSKAQDRFQADLASGRLRILNVGIAKEEGTTEFWINEVFDEWSSFDKELASRGHPHHAVQVVCKRLSSILAEFGVPYYLKVDIEGNDGLCIDELDRNNLPQYFSVEFNHISLLQRIRDLGYTSFKCVDQANYLPVSSPRTPTYLLNSAVLKAVYRARSHPALVPYVDRHGQRLIYRVARRSRTDGTWSFAHGASGPFGQWLSGRWSDAAAVTRAWEKECRRRDRSGTPKWFDLHARLSPHS